MRARDALLRAGMLAGAAAVLTSCASTTPTATQQFRRYFVPPVPAISAESVVIEAPVLAIAYANEAPDFTDSLPSLPRPTDSEFLIKRADDRFASGKRAFQAGRPEDARRDFDRALEILLNAPENIAGRALLDRKIEDLTDAIYRYDVDQLGAGEPEEQVSYEKPPLEDILDMTFPVEPTLRNKVQEQIRATASQLPLEESDAVVSYINFFSGTRGKKIIAYGLRRSGRYKDMIGRILTEEGVPQELIFLAQAESGFSPRAMSRARCVGIWQFAAFRGKEYGLNQTPSTDDRMDPDKATRAAAKHLHDLYSHFGDWYLAMAAYNCGPGCVDKAIERTGYADFWQLRRLNVLPKETANYVPAILAMTIMAKNAKYYGLDDLDADPKLEYDSVEVQSATHLALIAEAVDRPLSEIREMNPGVLHLVAPAGQTIHIPKGTSTQVEAVFHVIPPDHRDSWRAHRVESGETFADVAKRFNMGAAALSATNHDEMPEPGAWIALPVSYPVDRRPTTVKSASAKAANKAPIRASIHKAAPKPAAQHKAVAAKPALSTPKSLSKTTPHHATGSRS